MPNSVRVSRITADAFFPTLMSRVLVGAHDHPVHALAGDPEEEFGWGCVALPRCCHDLRKPRYSNEFSTRCCLFKRISVASIATKQVGAAPLERPAPRHPITGGS